MSNMADYDLWLQEYGFTDSEESRAAYLAERGRQGMTPIELAAQTIDGVLTDLREVQAQITVPMDELETERTARILDRLAEEIREAAAAVRASR